MKLWLLGLALCCASHFIAWSVGFWQADQRALAHVERSLETAEDCRLALTACGLGVAEGRY